MADVRVYLEEGKHWCFAAAIDWPGWCRRAKSPHEAVVELEAYRERYAQAVSPRRVAGRLEVIGSVPGDGTTDYGAPNSRGPWDDEELTVSARKRQITLLEQCWHYFDDVVATSSPTLRKGPRGGGRDRDGVVSHVMEAERAYSPKVGIRVAPRTPWPEQRHLIVSGLKVATDTTWPVSYAIRRIAWHVLDHAWEVEDKRD
jgi:hypothetical protein